MKTMAKKQRRSAVLRRHESRQTAGNRTRAKTIAFAIVALIGMAFVFAAGAQREQAAWAEAEFIGYPPGIGRFRTRKRNPKVRCARWPSGWRVKAKTPSPAWSRD